MSTYPASRLTRVLIAFSLVAVLALTGCGAAGSSQPSASAPNLPPRKARVQPPPRPQWDPFLDDVQERTFRWFWDTANPANGLVPDRWPTPSFSSVAAVGFGLTAYPVGVEHGWVTRDQAVARVKTTLEFFLSAPQGPEASGTIGYKGFFYHFLDMTTGARFERVELSSIDTTLFLAGALSCGRYFDRDVPDEAAIRAGAQALYERVDWTWMQPRPPFVATGWSPEDGFIQYDWKIYDESMILYVLALGSPTHPVAPEAWTARFDTLSWGTFQGLDFLQFAPLFGHQYSHVWIDFRGIQDAFMRDRGIDYFENSRRATLAQRAYAAANETRWLGYGPNVWGLSACDGPADLQRSFNGRMRTFWTYTARGAAAGEVRDDGTIAPTAAGGSIPFAPEVCIPALRAIAQRGGSDIYDRYGFLDSFNPSFTFTDVTLHHGKIVAGKGWFDLDHLGIDQGPIVLMIENHRDEFVWKLMRGDPAIVTGLRRAGFTGGWLDAAP